MKRLLVFVLVLLLFGGCAGYPGYEIGTVRLITDGAEHEASVQPLHSLRYGVAASSHNWSWWLDENFHMMTRIPYTEDMRIVIDGRDGTVTSPVYPIEYRDELAGLVISVESRSSSGLVFASLFEDSGLYLVSITVRWGNDRANAINQYHFRIAR